jgi:curved DNA-binding protein CbpA
LQKIFDFILRKNYYQILNVSTNASLNEVKTAYRKLVIKYHPDKNPNHQDLFIQIVEAYETLSDPTKKSLYDHSLKSNNFSNQIPNPNPTNYSSLIPEIEFFYCNRTQIFSNEIIEFYWRTKNADAVYLYPIGLVSASGYKKIRFNAFKAKSTNVELAAYNSISKKKIKRYFEIINISHLSNKDKFPILLKRFKTFVRKYKPILYPLFFFFLITVFTLFASSRKTQEVLIEYKTNQYFLRCDYDVDTNKLKNEFKSKMINIEKMNFQISEKLLADSFYHQINYFEQRFYKNRY